MSGFHLSIISMASDVFCDIRDAWILLVNNLKVISAAGADFLIIEMPVFYFKIIFK